MKHFKILLGARSICVSFDVFSSVESQSSRGLVDGKLRKLCVIVNKLEVALSGNYILWRNKYDDIHIGMVKSEEFSTYKTYYSHSLDNISINESAEIS